MTKQEQRNMILKKLYWFKKDQEENLSKAQYDFERELAYHTLDALQKVIRKAMDIKPISCSTEWGTNWQYVIRNFTYSDADNAKVNEVVRRMVEQGFIRIRKSSKYNCTMVEVLKTR